MSKPPTVERRRVGRTPMTLEEALRIERNAAEGRLDLSDRSTVAIVEEAHRVHLIAELWGTDARARRRSRATFLVIAVGIVVTILGLVASLAFSQ
ncbi:hypothetical protein [Gryllotalpicola ginsengisoli]|uniref:hypothetical protein n=1 Tax=Gryllotalpicola ginsengisoli TaxID=444608 RepID=UPI0003B63349|nr:hypothetical protein [Gryllotalpicola ginsengisoli]